MSASYVVDASVGIQMFLDEEYSQAVEVLFTSDASLLVPDLFHIECANILWKRVRRGIYPQHSAHENLADLYAMNLPTTPTADLILRALELGCEYGATAYDACYLALAERHGVPLLTVDQAVRKALEGSHIKVLTMAEYLAG